jgi:flagellar P-ring protein precursor FlgI
MSIQWRGAAAALASAVMIAAAPAGLSAAAQGGGVEIGSIATVIGVHAHPLVGYGLVTGLAGTGDTGQAVYTTQSIANMLARFGVRIPPGTRFDIGNVAAVMVTGDLPAFAPEGSRFAVTVSSMGNAKSLQGGVLLETPLEDAQGHVHAVAQGPLSIGGVNAQQAGSQVQINHPTVGLMPDGGLVVDPVEDALTVDGHGVIRLALRTPDYATADEVARAISMAGLGQAAAQDASTVAVVPSEGDRAHLAAWLGRVLRLRVTPHAPARVVLNERTGTIVAGGDVYLLPAAVAHGSIKVVIRNTTQVSQPGPLSGGATVVVPNAQISVQQGASPVVLVQGAATLGDLVAALNALGVPPRDLIAIIEALKEAGALQAELVVL